MDKSLISTRAIADEVARAPTHIPGTWATGIPREWAGELGNPDQRTSICSPTEKLSLFAGPCDSHRAMAAPGQRLGEELRLAAERDHDRAIGGHLRGNDVARAQAGKLFGGDLGGRPAYAQLGKGDESDFPERPGQCCAEIGPVPLFPSAVPSFPPALAASRSMARQGMQIRAMPLAENEDRSNFPERPAAHCEETGPGPVFLSPMSSRKPTTKTRSSVGKLRSSRGLLTTSTRSRERGGEAERGRGETRPPTLIRKFPPLPLSPSPLFRSNSTRGIEGRRGRFGPLAQARSRSADAMAARLRPLRPAGDRSSGTGLPVRYRAKGNRPVPAGPAPDYVETGGNVQRGDERAVGLRIDGSGANLDRASQ